MKNITFEDEMSKTTLLQAFGYAFKGLSLVLKERNFKLHLVSTALVIICGVLVNVSKMEWIVLLLCIGIVLSLEIVNTSLEKLTDLVSPERHPLAGATKDLAAAAVFCFSILSAIIGAIIFLPYFFN